jgi:hypothetical protein
LKDPLLISVGLFVVACCQKRNDVWLSPFGSWSSTDGSFGRMKKRSIRFHLSPYSILKKRKTTINHAFASAIGPVDE